MTAGTPWGIVLAAGDGSRLRLLTRDGRGRNVPKQFCSFDGGPTLLERALERAARVVGGERVVAIVAAEHREHWEPLLARWPSVQAVVQPCNRGTAAGVLLPLREVLRRDPDARVVVLPADHDVEHEPILQIALLEALDRVRRTDAVALLGIPPDTDDPEYGWILPEPAPGRWHGVQCFVEKPWPHVAAELRSRGALWNAFLLAARGASLLRLFEQRLPRLARAFQAHLAGAGTRALGELYARLETHDFSRAVLQGSEAELLVVEAPPCGWTDLGTPERVAARVRRRRTGAATRLHALRGATPQSALRVSR